MRNFGKSTGIIFTAKFQLCEPLERQPQTSRFVKKVGDKSKS